MGPALEATMSFVTSTTVGRGDEGGNRSASPGSIEIGLGPAEYVQCRNKSEGLAYPSPGLPRYVATPGYGPQTELNPVGIAYAGAG